MMSSQSMPGLYSHAQVGRIRGRKGQCRPLPFVEAPMLLATFLLAATTTPLGMVVTSEHANVGNAVADVGTTVYSGDKLSTDAGGQLQIRAGAARLALLQGSTAELTDGPSAKLVVGTVQFSTLKADALTLTVLNAIVRANTDNATIGQVT